MSRSIGPAAFAFLLTLLSGSELRAQWRPAPRPGEDWVSARVHFGMLAPTSTFTDPSFGESSFQSGAALGLSVMTWPWQGRLGFGAQVFRSQTDGYNAEHELAPLALNDPVQWIFTTDVSLRHPMESGFPYVSAGVGLKQYNWAVSRHKEDRFFVWNLAAGFEYRPRVLGPFGLAAELRSYHSKFKGFGIDDGNWRPGTEARPGIGFYGGVVGGQANHDLLFSAGLSVPF